MWPDYHLEKMAKLEFKDSSRIVTIETWVGSIDRMVKSSQCFPTSFNLTMFILCDFVLSM